MDRVGVGNKLGQMCYSSRLFKACDPVKFVRSALSAGGHVPAGVIPLLMVSVLMAHLSLVACPFPCIYRPDFSHI